MITTLALLLTLAAPSQATTELVTIEQSTVEVPPGDSLRADREIRLVALRHVADVRRCYEREGLTRDPRLSGTLELTVTVLATGVVSDVGVSASDMTGIGAREVAMCLTTAVSNWRFDRGPYTVETIVFPFRFRPEPGGATRVVSG
jgi:hypothetical protein